jgi:hypothetical protein
LINKD